MCYSQHNDFSVINQSNINSVIENPTNLIHTSDIEFSFFPVANTQFDLVLPFSMSTMLVAKDNSNYTLDLTNLSENAQSNNTFYSASSSTLLYLSVKAVNSYWNFYVKEQFISAMGIEHTFFDFLNLGNKAYVGETINFSFPTALVHYRKFSFSWAKQLNERWDVGLAGNLYFGKSMVNVRPNFSLFTQSDIDYLEFGVRGSGNVSFPVSFSDSMASVESVKDIANKYLFGAENPGLGIDIGVSYKLNNKLSANLNINDLGYINWKNENTQIDVDGSFKWNGVNVSGIVDFKDSTAFNDELPVVGSPDSVFNNLIDFNESDYLWTTPAGLTFGVNFQYSEKLKFSIHNSIQYFVPFIRNYFAATGSYELGHKWNVMSGLSFTNNSYFNVPFGLVYTGKRVRSTFNLSNAMGVFLPEQSSRFGGSISLTFLLNYRQNKINKGEKGYPFYFDVEE